MRYSITPIQGLSLLLPGITALLIEFSNEVQSNASTDVTSDMSADARLVWLREAMIY